MWIIDVTCIVNLFYVSDEFKKFCASWFCHWYFAHSFWLTNRLVEQLDMSWEFWELTENYERVITFIQIVLLIKRLLGMLSKFTNLSVFVIHERIRLKIVLNMFGVSWGKKNSLSSKKGNWKRKRKKKGSGKEENTDWICLW